MGQWIEQARAQRKGDAGQQNTKSERVLCVTGRAHGPDARAPPGAFRLLRPIRPAGSAVCPAPAPGQKETAREGRPVVVAGERRHETDVAPPRDRVTAMAWNYTQPDAAHRAPPGDDTPRSVQ